MNSLADTTADTFLERLDALKSDAEREKYRRYFKGGVGVPGQEEVLRAADGVDRERLLRFLDQHAASMPRTTLRAAMEHFPPELKARYRS